MKLSVLTHVGPIVVYNQVVGQVEAFDNLVPFIVEALHHNTRLACDVMAYCIVNLLGRNSLKLKEGDTHYSSWFGALAKFTGVFFKRFCDTDLEGLLQYLLRKLTSGESLDLLVLKELLCRMGGCETLDDVSAEQLEGLAAGKILRAEAMGAAARDPVSKRSTTALPPLCEMHW